MSEATIEVGHHYRLLGDQKGKIIKVFNVVEDTLLVGGVLYDPETNGMHYTQGFAPSDPAWADHAHVHIDPNSPAIYREEIGEELSSDQLHLYAVRARSAMSHFASRDIGPLGAWHKKLFANPENE